jgi:hypothetical protein
VPKGQIPWNKGLKGFRPSPATEFKAGGKDHCCWKGGVQHNQNDCIYLQDPNTPYVRVRRPRAVWEGAHGKLPQGMVVIHLDGDRYNDALENLKAITRAENMARNSNNTPKNPKGRTI